MKLLPFLLAATASVALAAPQDVQQFLTDAQTAYMRGDLETARANFEMVYKLDPRNQTAIAYLKRIKLEQAKTAGGGASTEKKLAAVIIPKIEFREATLREALDFLRTKVNDETGGKTPVNFVLHLPEDAAAAKITVSLTNIPFTEALRYIGGLAGVDFVYDKYAIVAKPAGAKGAEPKPAN